MPPAHLRALTVTAGLAIAGLLQTVGAQQKPAFRSSQTVVPVFTTVTDSNQRLVTDLDRDDFLIYDNDKLQQLTVFDDQTQPITLVVMLDTSASMELNLPLLRQAAEQFLARLYPGDKAKVGAFNDKIQIMRSFTGNRDALMSEVRGMDFGNGTRLWDALAEGIEALKGVEGRRVVLIFTDGADSDSDTGLGTVLDRARQDEVMVYAIGLESEFLGTRTKPDGGLRRLAEETGGGYFQLEKSADLGATFTRVAQELHSQYTLGFVPAVLDNKTHKLAVKLKQGGMTARARRTYIAKEQTASDK